MQMFSKIFANFCVWVLTHNALQHLFFFLPIFCSNWRRFSPLLFSILFVEVRRSKSGLVSFDTPDYKFCTKMRATISNINKTIKHTRKMHAAIYRATEQENRVIVRNALNIHCIICFMKEIYYDWLLTTVLWMNCSNLHLIWSYKMVSCLHKILKTFWTSSPHFMSVLKIVHRSPGSHDKVVYKVIFCYAYKSNQVIIVYNQHPGCTAVMMTIYVFAFWF